MRILFLTLLVLNLGFLGYHLAFGGDGPATETDVLPGQDVATLEPLPSLPDQAGDGDTTDAEATGSGARSTATMAEAMAGATESREEGEAGSDAEAAAPERSPEPAASGPESGQRSEPGPEPARVAAADKAEPDTGSQGVKVPESAPAICYAVGPLTPQLRSQIEGRARSSALEVVRHWEGERSEPRYWVHLPPAPDMAGARERQQALKAAGYRDILLVRNGDMARSISLGVFADRANASQHQQRLQADGFDARIREQERRTSAPFMGLRVPDGARDTLEELRRQVASSDAALTERPCDRLRKE